MDELFRTSDERFRDTFGPLPLRVRTLLERFLRSGDVHFGFLPLHSANPDCKNKGARLVSFSSQARHLSPTRRPRQSRATAGTRAQRRALQWAERMVEEVLPVVPYR